MTLSRYFLAATAAVLLSGLSFADFSGTPDTQTSFEFDDMTGQFALGTSPREINFFDGFTAVIGVPSIYLSGNHAWMITPGATGRAVFDTPASEIEFFARTQNAGTSGKVTVFATDGSVLGVFNPTNTGWTNVSIASAAPQISHFTVEHTGGAGVVAIEDFSYCANETGDSFCIGDGGKSAGCTNCPCMNNAPQGETGGCLNSAGSSARLYGSGDPNAAGVDTLRFQLSGAPPGAFCILNSGDNVAPTNMANPCFGMSSGAQAAAFDGLRCAVGNTRRHGGRAADANGDVGVTNNGWGPPNAPMMGFSTQAGFVSGQTRHFQVINRDDSTLGCMRGLNTSQSVRVTF